MSKTEFKVEIDETKVGGVAEPCGESQEPEGEDDGSGSGDSGSTGSGDTGSDSGSDDKTNRPGSGIGSTGPTRP